MNFEACSAFTHVTACTLAESPLRPSSTGGFSGFVTSTAAPIATGRNEPVPGWDLHPLWTKRLSRRTRTSSVTGMSEGASLGASSCEERRLIDDARHVKITVRLIYSFGVSTEEWFAFSSAQRSNSFLA